MNRAETPSFPVAEAGVEKMICLHQVASSFTGLKVLQVNPQEH
jgi:hypothetical protein